jgi:hypothetical protein
MVRLTRRSLMATNELEVLLTAAMLLALPVIAMCYWRDNRAISWGALGLCMLIPEAASERPNAALLHSIMVITAVIVVLQLWVDALKQPAATQEEAHPHAMPMGAPPDELPPAWPASEDTAAGWAGPMAPRPQHGATGLPVPAAPALHFLHREHAPAHGAWNEGHRGHEGQRP